MPLGSFHVGAAAYVRGLPAADSRVSPDVDILKQLDFLFFPTLRPTPTPPSKRITGNSQSFLTFL